MAKLSRIANVVIQLATTGITEQSFSDAMVLGITSAFLPRRIVITDADELLEMGVNAREPIYKAAAAWFSALPASRQLHVGRWIPSETGLTVQPNVQPGDVFKVRIGYIDSVTGQPASRETEVVANSNSPTSVATQLMGALSALNEPTSIIALENETPGQVNITSMTSSQISVSAQGKLVVDFGAPTETVESALAAAQGNWYGLMYAGREVDVVKSVAMWAEANEKLFGTATAAAGAFSPDSTTDLAYWAFSSQLFRTYVMAVKSADTQFPEAVLMSNRFTYYAGAETWALAKLPGITFDELPEGEAISAHAKNATTFELFRNFAVTQGGKVAAGEWIDVIRLRDQLAESIRISVVSAMINADGKIPYTDGGIAIIENAMRGPLNLNVDRGGIAPPELDEQDNLIPSYVITKPLAANVPFNDKANRVLNDMKFSARLAGAIHTTEIKGRLSYTL